MLQRRGWDSNPRALSDKRFSRPPRYDHFDISPNVCLKSRRLCCSPDDKSYSNKKVCYCQHIFTQFLFYFFKMRKSPFYHVFWPFLFLLNTVFFKNCVCYCVIVTNIPTICIFTTVCFSLQGIIPNPSYDFPYL